jgi:hypothetical protein
VRLLFRRRISSAAEPLSEEARRVRRALAVQDGTSPALACGSFRCSFGLHRWKVCEKEDDSRSGSPFVAEYGGPGARYNLARAKTWLAAAIASKWVSHIGVCKEEEWF